MCNHVQKVFRRREGSFDIPVKADIFPDQAVDGRFPLAADGGNVHVQKFGGLGVCPARIVQGQKNDLRLRVHCQDRFVYVFNLALSFFQGVGRSLCSGGPVLDRVGHLYQKAVRVGGRLDAGRIISDAARVGSGPDCFQVFFQGGALCVDLRFNSRHFLVVVLQYVVDAAGRLVRAVFLFFGVHAVHLLSCGRQKGSSPSSPSISAKPSFSM